jgi:hypothetical protein
MDAWMHAWMHGSTEPSSHAIMQSCSHAVMQSCKIKTGEPLNNLSLNMG